jgi:REP element-mobilizing transposase RayT
MARRLRIQFEGAIYHVINRGNYRRDVFESASTAAAFETVLGEACERHRWRLHAYVIMRNHYHLALETPEANLVDGMHWLQSTFATRFNRFRSERGHLFQGRYQALLVEDVWALSRVVDYIHLNPVRAQLVPVEQVGAFRWSSLARFLKTGRPGWLAAETWLESAGLTNTTQGWADYVTELKALAIDPVEQERRGFPELCRGWAIGTAGWRKAVAKDYAHLALHAGIETNELREIREARWSAALADVLAENGRSVDELRRAPKGVFWKVEIAKELRRKVGATHRWLAETLSMGSPHSVRSYLSRRR